MQVMNGTPTTGTNGNHQTPFGNWVRKHRIEVGSMVSQTRGARGRVVEIDFDAEQIALELRPHPNQSHTFIRRVTPDEIRVRS